MMTDGYSEDMLATAFDHLYENEKTTRGFLANNARLRKLWLDSFLFSQLWVFGCFMLTMTIALGINFCYSTSIDLPLYYICSLLYYWDDTIVQIMYLYYSDTTCKYHFCTPWRCNANSEWLMLLFLFEYYGYIQMIIFYVEVDGYFCIVTDMSRQDKCLNLDEYFCTVTGLFRQCRCFFYKAQVDKCWWGLKSVVRQWAVYFSTKVARHFIFSVKCLNKPNMGIDFP